ncbi:GumC family protein [Arcobacter roscoffensis]|uniref:non-specific protein-tyrosine kinase n=1 Tax=Arcobacter roscoffensis TaxID=2961520 RepID=A0ABY5E4Z4_9BACT|nr:polysaccharide biosynthesis tyrosine autokinase [Arcobacter roscoffensis]UTJ05798.1 polysaccharide biosynthesis tyrosine autokinase [Arcobacter roscoffensis]
MNQTNIQHHDQIDLKDVIKTIFRYKWSIIIITFIFTFGSAIFAYIKPNIYSSSATIELMEDKKKSASPADFMLQAFDGGGANVDNEIEVMKSRFLAKKAFNLLNLKTRYFTTHNFREIELYKDSPFVVNSHFLDDLLYGKEFILKPIDENSFNLRIEPISPYSIKGFLKNYGIIPLKAHEKIVYNKNHKYSETINNPYFTLNIKKIHALKNKEYRFSFMTNRGLYQFYRKNISVSQVSKKATILKLSFQDTSSLRAKEILNAVHQAYMNQEIEHKTKEANLTLGFIDRQLDSINARLKKSETKLEDFKEKNQVVGLGEQAIKTTEQLSEYEAKLEEMQTEITILSNLQQYIKSNQNLTGLTIGSVNFADPALGTLVNRLQEEATRKSTLLVDYTELHPDVQKVSQNISSLKRSIKAALRNNLRQLNQRKQSLRNVIAKFNKSIASLPKQERELSRLTRYYSIDEKIYSFLLEKKAETAILKSSTISNSRLLDSAVQNSYPIKPKRKLIVLVGIILGLIVGLALAFLREFFNNTVKNSDEIEKLCSIPLYGIIPQNKNKKTSNLVDEAYRAIRTNLQFLPKHESSEVIAITSSVSGEGKTTIAANLAKIIAQTNKKVVVLDLDLRKASLHNEFNISNNIGISNYLTKQNSLEEVLYHDENTNVDIITTGTIPPNPSELILTDNMKEFIEILKERYDYIIFDTPPVGLVTDAMILMNYADISFVVARASYTRKEFVKNLDRLSKEHTQNTFGMILNGVEIGEKYGYGYGSNYGYGYGNDKYYKNR